jgi:glutamyl-tRNA synthetase
MFNDAVPGRFAPSPTGPLHLGSLRTALAAWLVARSRGDRFVVRMEDLDPVVCSRDHEAAQLRDLAALGLDWDGPVWRQSERSDAYALALARLDRLGVTYECFCSRREIRAAAAAPHGGELVYPGTCRDLTAAERSARRAVRRPAVRFRSDPDEVIVVDDALAGRYEGRPSDVVLRRNDGVTAYHLAVVVDDAAQGVDHVVRGDDLIVSTPAQVALQRALGLPELQYLHIPMVVGATGERLAKRDGAVTLADLDADGFGVDEVRAALAWSLGLLEHDVSLGAGDLAALSLRFDLSVVRGLGRAPIQASTLRDRDTTR